MSLRVRSLVALALVLPVFAHRNPGSAQCMEWSREFGLPGLADRVLAMAVFDDGTGPALYAAGQFEMAGAVQASYVAKWDGTSWSAVDTGLDSWVLALAVFDDGTGPALYAAGTFTRAGNVRVRNIAKWNGTSWSDVGGGTDDIVCALAVYDDGSGPALHAGGFFNNAGGVPAKTIAKWDGTAWSAVGGGIGTGTEWVTVRALTVYDDGTGPALWVGGSFNSAGGQTARRIVKWNGTSWSPLGYGSLNDVSALAGFDDGSGPALYVEGGFSLDGPPHWYALGRWKGSWSPAGHPETRASSLAVLDDGTGPALYGGGTFVLAGGQVFTGVTRWNGTDWMPIAGAMDGQVTALAMFGQGSSPRLVAAGGFTLAGNRSISRIAQRFEGAWSPLGETPTGSGLGWTVTALSSFDDGSGLALYASGWFTAAGGIPADHIAKWNGAAWSPVGAGLDGPAYAFATFDDGNGPALYAGGGFLSAGGVPGTRNVARWNGSTWSELDGGADNEVRALAVFDDGGGRALYAGGMFGQVGSGSAWVNGIARWDGVGWTPLGSWLGADGPVNALCVHDDGSGPALYAAGAFYRIDTTYSSHVARWDGTAWSGVGYSGIGGEHVSCLAVFDDGGGPALYAGGHFLFAGGPGFNNIAKWDGNAWSPVGSGLFGQVDTLAVFDDGSGSALYAGGSFGTEYYTPVEGIARWNGSSWSTLGDGTKLRVRALAAFDDASGVGRSLYLGGDMTVVDGVPSSYIAAWRGCTGPGVLFCSGDGVATACPCGNSGQPGHGCENSASRSGAILASSGAVQPDTVQLTAWGEPSRASSIFLQGDATVAPVAFGDGLGCVGGNLLRLYVRTASEGTATAPGRGDPGIKARSTALGDSISPGTTRYYVTYYRDPRAGFCPPPAGGRFNATNGVRIAW